MWECANVLLLLTCSAYMRRLPTFLDETWEQYERDHPYILPRFQSTTRHPDGPQVRMRACMRMCRCACAPAGLRHTLAA